MNSPLGEVSGGLGVFFLDAWCSVRAWMRCAVMEVRACGRAMRATDCEVCAEGRAAMDADNDIGPEEMASLAPALEKMPQLTSIYLGGARIPFWARPRGVWGSFSWVRGVGYALGWDGVWFGVRRLRASDVCDGYRGVCLRGGRRWMQRIRSGVRGRHRWRRRWRRCRSSPRSTSEVRGFALGRGLGAFGGLFFGCVPLGSLDAVWCGWGYALAGGRCVRRIARCVLEGRAAMDAVNQLEPEGAASLAPALEEMTQLTSLDLHCARIRFWARRLGVWGSFSLVRAVGYALGCDVVWSGYDACGRAISATDCEVCA